ncbi:transcriptional regulator, DNA-binding protein [Alteracholeplasma palmae J233]|uniref:Transcriptional regulator, DNA-binding protein n=1 Tax=Alteracholeplasma palmae (strain ATCC 49389 / J233) TaxID=1318466 RepID=U4KK76_ALTPJ|nr:helix-turn-helix transcriptional regulator [Alteracholeplasma palmae]CCV63942.1 transcriptional regulator, DNA-binding protein [Alteracholeplasma palmae J233]
MFNMKEIGKKISTLRKNNNLTQLELADKLGITYQAVSNWERGDSMPDISKLSELSQIFNVTIDELLGNSKVSETVEKIINQEKVDVNDLKEEELESLLPLVKPQQFEESFDDFNDIPFKKLIMIAPFLEEEDLEKIIKGNKEILNSKKMIAFAPFISGSFLSEIIVKNSSDDHFDIGMLTGLAPFMSTEALNSVAFKAYEKKGIEFIISLAPFLDSSILKEIVKRENQKDNPSPITALLPFITGDGYDLSDILKMFGRKK